MEIVVNDSIMHVQEILNSILKVKLKVLMTYHDLRDGTKGNKMRMYVTVS